MIVNFITNKFFSNPINIKYFGNKIKIVFFDGRSFSTVYLKKCADVIKIKDDLNNDYTDELKNYFNWEQEYPNLKLLNLNKNIEVLYNNDTTIAIQD